MSDGPQRTAKTIRLREEAYHQARVAAVTSKKSLGQWLEEAIGEKLAREEAASQLSESPLFGDESVQFPKL